MTPSPTGVPALSNQQRAFLAQTATTLADVEWTPDSIATKLAETAQLTPIEETEALDAVRILVLDKKSGPKANNLLAFLEREDALNRLSRVRYSHWHLLKETALTEDVVLEFIRSNLAEIARIEVSPEFATVRIDHQDSSDSRKTRFYLDGIGVADLVVHHTNGIRNRLRVELVAFKGESCTPDTESEIFREEFDIFVDVIKTTIGRSEHVIVRPKVPGQ